MRQEPHSISKPRLDSLNSLDEKPDPHEGFTFLPSFIADWLDDIKQSRDQDDESCKEGDLTNHFALILQGALGFISFGVLILKRLCEPEETRRTWTIWFLDTSKQGLGMMFMHVINVYLSETNSNKNADPCTFYLTSFILDTTVGLCIIWALMKSSEHWGGLDKFLEGSQIFTEAQNLTFQTRFSYRHQIQNFRWIAFRRVRKVQLRLTRRRRALRSNRGSRRSSHYPEPDQRV